MVIKSREFRQFGELGISTISFPAVTGDESRSSQTLLMSTSYDSIRIGSLQDFLT
jgi:hypothetical protein